MLGCEGKLAEQGERRKDGRKDVVRGIGNHNRIICGRKITTFIYFSLGKRPSGGPTQSYLIVYLLFMVNFSRLFSRCRIALSARYDENSSWLCGKFSIFPRNVHLSSGRTHANGWWDGTIQFQLHSIWCFIASFAASRLLWAFFGQHDCAAADSASAVLSQWSGWFWWYALKRPTE